VRLDPACFEALYSEHGDPWGFETSGYEAAKYRRTLDALPSGRRFARALECGCSIGVFTERLAERCDALVAVDASATAIAAARPRLAGLGHVAVERRTLPEELPPGPFDLVVCSELLYYFDAAALHELLTALEARLVAGGTLLAVHLRRETRTYPQQGDAVHDLLLDRAALEHLGGHTTADYRLDVFGRRGEGA
jgi:predicted TPR repeat methyltransferase